MENYKFKHKIIIHAENQIQVIKVLLKYGTVEESTYLFPNQYYFHTDYPKDDIEMVGILQVIEK